MNHNKAAALIALLSGCSQPTPTPSQQGNAAVAAPADKPQPSPARPVAAAPSTRHSITVGEPIGTIDPKSVAAAGQVVQRYGALIGDGRFADAARLWTSTDSAARFALELKPYSNLHLEIGKLGDAEGAAGSIYTTVPVVFLGRGYQRSAAIILRRVNDVPGSTADQRRWHIERIAWKGAA